MHVIATSKEFHLNYSKLWLHQQCACWIVHVRIEPKELGCRGELSHHMYIIVLILEEIHGLNILYSPFSYRYNIEINKKEKNMVMQKNRVYKRVSAETTVVVNKK